MLLKLLYIAVEIGFGIVVVEEDIVLPYWELDYSALLTRQVVTHRLTSIYGVEKENHSLWIGFLYHLRPIKNDLDVRLGTVEVTEIFLMDMTARW